MYISLQKKLRSSYKNIIQEEGLLVIKKFNQLIEIV